MNKRALSLLGVLTFCAASFAAAADGLSKDEQTLENTSSELDKTATPSEGQKTVESKLKSEFKVDDARIQGLRGQKLGYGEVSIVLALAQKMPGGITDANVNMIMAMRQGPPVMGWGQIAKKHGVKLGKVIGKVKNVDAAARKQGKADIKSLNKKEATAEKSAHSEKSARPEPSERLEHSGHMEQTERSERPEMPRNSKH